MAATTIARAQRSAGRLNLRLAGVQPEPVEVRRLLSNIGERLPQGSHRRAEDAGTVLAAPLARADRGIQAALEPRHHPASEQFVAAQRLLSVGPFMCPEQHGYCPD